MTYVTEQTSGELRAHMRRLQAMPGWHNPLDDRLYREILDQDAEIERLKAKERADVPPGMVLVPMEPTPEMIEAVRLKYPFLFDAKRFAEDWQLVVNAISQDSAKETK